MVRQPSFAGTFYPAEPQQLKEQIEECFTHKLGPGKITIEVKESNAIGAIIPHAGYYFSGACAAYAYKEIKKTGKKIFIILGTDHTGQGTALSDEDWQTPLGIAKIDKDLAKELEKAGIRKNNKAHNPEHSIEVQLPFLQYITDNNFTFVPIIISINENYRKIAEIIADTMKIFRKDAFIIASSDFTHYGDNYGFVPFTNNIKENMYKLDKEAIEAIINFDPEKFLDIAEKTTICGQGTIPVLIECSKLLKAKEGRLLKYYTSGEISGEYSNCVGYAAILIE